FVRIKNFKELQKKCLIGKNKVSEYTSEVSLCLDRSYFGFWAGVGNFELSLKDMEIDQTQTLSATSFFLGAQFMHSLSLSRLLIFEGKYYYLPSFSNSDVGAMENLNVASFSSL